MNIAFFSSHILLSSHYETELELIANHLLQGDSVTQLVCEASLSACDTSFSINETKFVSMVRLSKK